MDGAAYAAHAVVDAAGSMAVRATRFECRDGLLQQPCGLRAVAGAPDGALLWAGDRGLLLVGAPGGTWALVVPIDAPGAQVEDGFPCAEPGEVGADACPDLSALAFGTDGSVVVVGQRETIWRREVGLDGSVVWQRVRGSAPGGGALAPDLHAVALGTAPGPGGSPRAAGIAVGSGTVFGSFDGQLVQWHRIPMPRSLVDGGIPPTLRAASWPPDVATPLLGGGSGVTAAIAGFNGHVRTGQATSLDLNPSGVAYATVRFDLSALRARDGLGSVSLSASRWACLLYTSDAADE